MQRALDVLVYAPAGLVLQAAEELPAMTAKGRDRIEVHVENARIVGMFVMTKARRDLERRIESAQSRTANRGRSTPPGDHGSPQTGSAEDARGGAEPERQDRSEPPQRPVPAPPRLRSLPSERAGTAAADAAIEGYDTLSASQVVRRLDGLGADELSAVYRHEAATRGRRTILHRAQQLLGAAGTPPPGTGSHNA